MYVLASNFFNQKSPFVKFHSTHNFYFSNHLMAFFSFYFSLIRFDLIYGHRNLLFFLFPLSTHTHIYTLYKDMLYFQQCLNDVEVKLSYLWTKLLGSCIELSNRVSYDVLIYPIYFYIDTSNKVFFFHYHIYIFLLSFSSSSSFTDFITKHFTLFLNCERQSSNDGNYEVIRDKDKNVQDAEINILIVTFIVFMI